MSLFDLKGPAFLEQFAVVFFGAAALAALLRSFPGVGRPVESPGRVIWRPRAGWLHERKRMNT